MFTITLQLLLLSLCSISYLYSCCLPLETGTDLLCQTTTPYFLHCYTISLGKFFVDFRETGGPSQPRLTLVFPDTPTFPYPARLLRGSFAIILTEFSQAASDIHCWRAKPFLSLPVWQVLCSVRGLQSFLAGFMHGSFSLCFPPELVSSGPLEVLDQLWEVPSFKTKVTHLWQSAILHAPLPHKNAQKQLSFG